MTELGLMHPASRIARAVQQLRSFTELHGRELDHLAADLEAAGLAELAGRLRVFRSLQADEVGVVADELEHVQSTFTEPEAEAQTAPDDPAAASPKRAQWLADQARRANPRPLSRRDVLTRRG